MRAADTITRDADKQSRYRRETNGITTNLGIEKRFIELVLYIHRYLYIIIAAGT